MGGKGVGQLYPIYTHEDGRTCSSKAQLLKLGGTDNSVDRRSLRKGKPKPKAKPKTQDAKPKRKSKAKAAPKVQENVSSCSDLDSDENL